MDDRERADAVAHRIAMASLMQTIYGALMNAGSKADFRQMAQALEEATVKNLEQLSTQADELTTEYVREAASGYVSRFFASIRVPPHLP
ncbi:MULTISPECIES: hypothetical protein [unclassified Bosea (in: a-proteobacteria)]|uniref:hypothetical protein n=1 Tax=unclassified Bosea (in: a-proteobacteria) TaxID=2653178 RepID=UPI000F7E3DD3|nr:MULTISPECIES: hypothetical protein [unclassified Bosea (in: a-proteobacteria)]